MSSTLGARPAATRTFSTSSVFLVARPDSHRDAGLTHLDVADLCAEQGVDLPAAKRLSQLDGHVTVLEGKKGRQNSMSVT